MRSLRAGQDDIRGAWRSGCGWQQAHLDTLEPHELHASAPVLSAAPISPEQWRGTRRQRMQQHADLAWLLGGATLPLARHTPRTGTTTADAGSIHHAQASIGFSALFMWDQLLGSLAAQRPIRLEDEVLAADSVSFPGQAHLRGSIAREGSCVQ